MVVQPNILYLFLLNYCTLIVLLLLMYELSIGKLL